MKWIKIDEENGYDLPNYYDQILLRIEQDGDFFYSLGFYEHANEKFIVDYQKRPYNFKISHYLEISGIE